MADEHDGIIGLEDRPVMEGRQLKIIMDSQLLSSMMACPRMGQLSFVRNFKANKGKSNALEAGSMVHTISEFYNKAIKDGKSRIDAIAIGFEAGQEYVLPYSPNNKYVKDREHTGIQNMPMEDDPKATSVAQVVKTMEEYFDHYRNDLWTVVDVEHVRGRVIFEDSDIKILWKAKYDLIVDTNIGIHSVDHKTMKQRKDTMVLNNQFIGQCTLLNSRNVIIDKIGFQKTLKPSEKFTRPVVSYSLDIMEEWRNDIVPYYARMWAAYCEAGYFPPNYTHCENKYGYCQFYEDICRSDRGMREESLKIFFHEGKPWDVNNDED